MKIKIPDTIRITNPLWTEKLETRTTWDEVNQTCVVDGVELNIGSYGCCIVGEALNLHDVDYDDFCVEHVGKYYEDTSILYHNGCNDCYEYSMKLYNNVHKYTYKLTVDLKLFEKDLNGFAEHLEDIHPNYIRNAKRRNGKKQS